MSEKELVKVPKKRGPKPKPKPPVKKGRPEKYDADLHPKLVYALAVRGLNDAEMAKEIGIAESTLYLWIEKYPAFSELMKRGKEDPDSAVENALFRKATGMTYETEKVVVVNEGQGMGSSIEKVTYKETIPPSDTAMIFWLKNRRPDRWREKQEVEHSGSVDMTTLTAEEYEAKKAEFLARHGSSIKGN